MKKILLVFSLMLALVNCSLAQNFHEAGFRKFYTEIKSACSSGAEHVRSQQEKVLQLHFRSDDLKSYNKISAIIDKYDIFFADELFGLSLYYAIREAGVRLSVFYNDGIALFIQDVAYDSVVEIVFVRDIKVTQLASVVKQPDLSLVQFDLSPVQFKTDDSDGVAAVMEEEKEECTLPESEIQCHIPRCVMQALSGYYAPKIDSLRNEMKNASEERALGIKAEINAIEKLYVDEYNAIRKKIDGIARTSFVDIPCIGKSYLVAPVLSEEEKLNAEPQAREGILDWINGTGFYIGYDKGIIGKNGQRSCILRPTDVVVEYVRKHSDKKSWNAYGYSPLMEAIFKKEIQGGEPLYLYRVSDTEEGYRCMVKDLEPILDRKVREKYMNMKVTARVENNGMRFVQLYSASGTVLVFDSPAEKLCRMDVVIGGIGAFEAAVNDFTVDGVAGVAQRCNIVIDLNDIELIEGPYKKNGVSYEYGVHFETGYWDKLNQRQMNK